jgi:hypothetical protein
MSAQVLMITLEFERSLVKFFSSELYFESA